MCEGMLACQKEYKDQHYIVNKKKYITDSARRNAELAGRLRDYVYHLKSTTPCADCGHKFHYCQMEFVRIAIASEHSVEMPTTIPRMTTT